MLPTLPQPLLAPPPEPGLRCRMPPHSPKAAAPLSSPKSKSDLVTMSHIRPDSNNNNNNTQPDPSSSPPPLTANLIITATDGDIDPSITPVALNTSISTTATIGRAASKFRRNSERSIKRTPEEVAAEEARREEDRAKKEAERVRKEIEMKDLKNRQVRISSHTHRNLMYVSVAHTHSCTIACQRRS